jgi:hypothetical protein
MLSLAIFFNFKYLAGNKGGSELASLAPNLFEQNPWREKRTA